MPQLPSGRHIAVTFGPLDELLDRLNAGENLASLLDVTQPTDLFSYLPVMYFREKTSESQDVTLIAGSSSLPQRLEPYYSGFTLETLKPEILTWDSLDRDALMFWLEGEGIWGQLMLRLEQIKTIGSSDKGQSDNPPSIGAVWRIDPQFWILLLR